MANESERSSGGRPRLVASRCRGLKLQAIYCRRASGEEIVCRVQGDDYQALVTEAAAIASQPGDTWGYVNVKGMRKLWARADVPEPEPATAGELATLPAAAPAAAARIAPSVTLHRSANALAAGKVKAPEAETMWGAVQLVSAIYEDAFARAQAMTENQGASLVNILTVQNDRLMDQAGRVTELEIRLDQARAAAAEAQTDPVEAEFVRLAGSAIDKWQPKGQQALPPAETPAGQLPGPPAFDWRQWEL
jgi:hypothetical protein